MPHILINSWRETVEVLNHCNLALVTTLRPPYWALFPISARCVEAFLTGQCEEAKRTQPLRRKCGLLSLALGWANEFRGVRTKNIESHLVLSR